MMYLLSYFARSKGICGSDFENSQKSILINTDYIISVGSIEEFRLPLTGRIVPDSRYSAVKIYPDTTYYIRAVELFKLKEILRQK